jgi:hypothetical protein
MYCREHCESRFEADSGSEADDAEVQDHLKTPTAAVLKRRPTTARNPGQKIQFV